MMIYWYHLAALRSSRGLGVLESRVFRYLLRTELGIAYEATSTTYREVL